MICVQQWYLQLYKKFQYIHCTLSLQLMLARLREAVRQEQMEEAEGKRSSKEILTFEEMLRKRLNEKKGQALSEDKERAEVLPEPSPIVYNPNADSRHSCEFTL